MKCFISVTPTISSNFISALNLLFATSSVANQYNEVNAIKSTSEAYSFLLSISSWNGDTLWMFSSSTAALCTLDLEWSCIASFLHRRSGFLQKYLYCLDLNCSVFCIEDSTFILALYRQATITLYYD